MYKNQKVHFPKANKPYEALCRNDEGLDLSTDYKQVTCKRCLSYLGKYTLHGTGEKQMSAKIVKNNAEKAYRDILKDIVGRGDLGDEYENIDTETQKRNQRRLDKYNL